MDVLMPQLGETVAEGKITKWFKSAGDAVKPGDNLFEIETDKVSMEVPSTTTGMLAEIRVGVGEVAPVGAVVAVIAGDGAARRKPHASPAGRRRREAPSALRAKRRRPARSSPGSRCAASEPADARRQQRRRSARSVLRGAHARAQFWPGALAGRHVRHAAGAPAGVRGRDRSQPHHAVRPAWAHRRARRRDAAADAAARRRCRPWRAARRPPR